MLEKVKEKTLHFLRWVKDECGDRYTICLFIAVTALMYSPVWGGYLLNWMLGWKWCLAAATAYLVFWAGPFTPFFPCCIAITLLLKKIVTGRHKDGQTKRQTQDASSDGIQEDQPEDHIRRS